jgi:hypothetical protein
VAKASKIGAERPGGEPGVRLVLDAAEFEVLASIPERMRAILLDSETAAKVIDRLFPPAHLHDPVAEEEHRQLLGNTLWQQRVKALASFERLLEGAERWHRRVQLDLTPGQVDLVLHVINDVRLVLGTQLDIRENDWFEKRIAAADEAGSYYLLAALSALQEVVLAAVMRG